MKEAQSVVGPELSIEELVVADLLMLGFSQKRICEKLSMPPKEVRARCASILLKRGCRTTKELFDKGSGLILWNRQTSEQGEK